MTTLVKNLPTTHHRFVVAREVEGELWFWGSWDDESRAHEVAREVGGLVVSDKEV